jgi:PKD repeat protein
MALRATGEGTTPASRGAISCIQGHSYPATGAGVIKLLVAYNDAALPQAWPPYVWSWGPLPPGLIGTSGGALYGNPTTIGSWDVTATVRSDPPDVQSIATYWRVTVTPAPPVVTSSGAATAVVGVPFTYQITASNGPITNFGATAPAGFSGWSCNPSTGVVTGTPTSAGTRTSTLSATNSGGTGTKTLTITVSAGPPVVTAPYTLSVTKGAPVSFNIVATNSPTSYGAVGLPTGLSLVSPAGPAISGTPTVVGVSNVTLSATNVAGTGTHSLILTVIDVPPWINSPLTAAGTQDAAFSYQITATNGVPVSYGATGLPAGLNINTVTGLIDGTPTGFGTSSVTLTATNTGGTDTKTLVITIGQAPPTVTSAATASGARGIAFSYTVTATRSPTSFGATGLVGTGLSIDSGTGIISGTPVNTGVITSTISATNAFGTGTKTLTITIAPSLPVVTSSLTASGIQNDPFTYTITGTNSPNAFYSPDLPAGLVLDPVTGIITGTLLWAGSQSFTIQVSNSDGLGSATLVVYSAAPPVITSAATAQGIQNDPFSYFITATNLPTSFNATGLPTGLNVNVGTGEISGTPTVLGTTVVPISATNADGTATGSVTITVIYVAPPVIISPLTDTVVQSAPYAYQIQATNSPTLYGAPAGLPTGLSLDTGTGLIDGSVASPGVYNITITAANLGGFDTRTLVLTVTAALPVITSALTNAGQQGYPYSYTITATNSPLVFGATPLPAGLSLDSGTGIISGVPAHFGVTNVLISATNLGGSTYETLVITLVPGIPAPTIISSLTASTVTGQPFSYQIETDVIPISLYGASGLPLGLSIDTATGIISGTPTVTAQSYIGLSATNGTGTGTATLILDVSIAPPTITSANLALTTQGASFTYNTTSSPAATSYAADGLPLGLAINPGTGAITGTPIGEAGLYHVTLYATNAGGTGTLVLTIVVALFVPAAPVITSALTAGVQVNTPFLYQITASNSPTSFYATGLPAGLHVNSATGLIYGTPTVAAVTNVTLYATNAGGTGMDTLVLTVVVPVPKTINGTGVLTNRRTVIAGEGVLYDENGAAKRAVITPPLDEAETFVYPINDLDSTWNGPEPGPRSTG